MRERGHSARAAAATPRRRAGRSARAATAPRRRAGRSTLAAALLAALLAGCGSQDDPREFPPAAEPARAPRVSTPPVGSVTRVGGRPEGVAADAATGLVAVAVTDPDELALVGHREGRVVGRVPLPGAARHIRLAARGGPVLVPVESADRLVQVPLPRGGAGRPGAVGTTPTGDGRRLRVESTPTGDGPHDADAAAGRVLVADEFASTLSIVERGRTVRTVNTPLQPGGLAAIPGGPVALVAVRERVLALFDPRGRLLDEAPAGVGPTHVEAGAGGRVYVADTAGDAVLLFRTRPRLELVRRVALPGAPYGMAIDRTRGRLWVTLTARNEVVWLPANGAPRPVDRYATVRQPNSVAVHEPSGRVFVASRTDGTLQRFDPRR